MEEEAEEVFDITREKNQPANNEVLDVESAWLIQRSVDEYGKVCEEQSWEWMWKKKKYLVCGNGRACAQTGVWDERWEQELYWLIQVSCSYFIEDGGSRVDLKMSVGEKLKALRLIKNMFKVKLK